MDIRDRGRAALVVEPTIGLVVERERTGRIGFFHIDLYLCKFLIPVRFVRHRPEDDGRMVPVELDHLHIRLQYIRIVFRIAVVQHLPVLIRMMADPTDRCFHFHEHAQFVTDFEQLFTRRVMGSTDKIAVRIPVQLDILPFQGRIHHTSGQRMHFMPANSSQLDSLAIYQQTIPLYPDLAEAKTFLYLLDNLVRGSDFDFHRI